MSNAENARLTADERALADAEGQIAREEAEAARRLDQYSPAADVARGKTLAARIDALVQAGAVAPDLETARGIALTSFDGPVAVPERTQALNARRAALAARQAALQGVVHRIAEVENHRASLDAVEHFVQSFEAALKEAHEQARQAEAATRATAAAPPPPAPVAAVPAKPAAPAPSVAPPPSAPAKVEAKAPVATPAAKTPEPKAAAPKAPEPKAAPAKAASGPEKPPAKHVSRRRKVKLPPPPKKMQVEVAEYGDNNFFAGFDNRIATGGLFISSLENLPPNHEFDLEIELSGKKLATRARVEFSRADNPASPECSPGAGVKLLNLSNDQAAVIEAFFAKRQPMFHGQLGR